MNFHDLEWRAQLAGEYVLGTLEGDALREMNEQLQHDVELAALVVEWQEKLQPLALAVNPVNPPRTVWLRLQKQIGLSNPANQRSEVVTQFDPDRRKKRRQTRTKLIAWQWVGSLAMAACAVLAFALFQTQRTSQHHPYDAISIVSSEEAVALWVVNASLSTQTITITAIAPPDIEASQDHELWMVMPDDGGVRSLGILPKDNNSTVTVEVPQLQSDTVAFAVSLEPLGGSPESAPTGPVLYQGAFNRINETRR